MTKVLMCLFIVCETKFYVESRTISHANETQAQQVQNLAQEHFPPKLLWNENADFKFSVNNEGEDVNKKPRSRENIAQHSEGNATNKRQRNRRLESDALLMNFRVFIHAYTADVFPFVANTRTKSIQKQI